MIRKSKKKYIGKAVYFFIIIIILYSISTGYSLLHQDISVTGEATITYTGGGNNPSLPDNWDKDKVYGKKFDDGIVPIPSEFYYVTGDLSTGVVISDNSADENNDNASSGNQFVWIPVDFANFTTTDWKNNAPTGSLSSQYQEPSTQNSYPR